MGDTFIGEIKPFAGSYVPAGWVDCDGRQLAIQQFQLLFAVIGLQFGGNIQQNYFNVPNLRGRVAVGTGQGTGLSPWTTNLQAGAEEVALTPGQIPIHTHAISTNFGAYKTHATDFTNGPTANVSYLSRYLVPTGATTTNTYNAYYARVSGGPGPNTTMAPNLLQPTGASGAHENRQPVLALRFAINATAGVYPEYN